MTTRRLRIAFAGTPEFAAVALTALIEADQHDLIAVFTQPDRPAGRGRKLRPSAVKTLAETHQLKLLQPTSFKDAESLAALQALQLDLLIVVAYGQLLPQTILDTPALGCINVHASLLPRWRGAAPIQRAIEAGDAETGVTIMQMAEALDSGPMLSRAICPIEANDTAQSLHDKLAHLGAKTLIETLGHLATGNTTAEIQDESQVCYAAKISKQEAAIDWQQSAQLVLQKIRAFNPVPIAHTSLFGKENVRIWNAELIPYKGAKQAGEILQINRDGIDLACLQGGLRITRLQLPGKRAIDVSDFVNGNPQLLEQFQP